MIYLGYLLLGTIRQINSIDSPSKNANGNWKKEKKRLFSLHWYIL